MTFLDLVKEHFGFLESEYQFALSTDDPSSVVFKKPTLHILMGWYKGEVDIDFYIQAETAVLKPHRSRMFRFYKVVKRKEPGALQGAPRFPHYITTIEDCAKELKFASRVMKHACKDILDGDIKIFEDMLK